MKKNLSRDIAHINKCSFTRYMEILRMPVRASRPGCTDYDVLIHDTDHIVTVHHACNSFSSKTLDQAGQIVDFACLLFGLTPAELFSNIVPYGIDRLMSSEKPATDKPIEAAHP